MVKRSQHPNVKDPDKYRYVIKLFDVMMYTEKPISLDISTRQKLPYFKERDSENWSWFVQTVRRVSKEDFDILIGKTA